MPSKKWKWTDHIEQQIEERKIPKEFVESTLCNPDEIVPGKLGRMVYQKIIGNKLARVVTEKKMLITVYLTDKIEKYAGGKK